MIRKLVLKLWEKERGDTPFLIFASFTISLFIARAWVILTGAYEVKEVCDTITKVAGNLIIGGLHIHHITYGVILLSIAGLMSIYYKDKNFIRASAILYGAGLGLIIDQLGLAIEGLALYQPENLLPPYIIAIIVAGFLGALAYLPSFRKEMKKEKIKFKF
ncbi:MAG: hypothetical protein JSW73_02730 [Candidatus Woesearchaeota archaeon]|nr:MAG: hypothetical protein JSW73_02730 [Candidatus Woesearchaeota archaeon]